MRIVCLIAIVLYLVLDISGCKHSQEQAVLKTEVRAERKIERKPEQKVKEKIQISQSEESESTSIKSNPLIDRKKQRELFRSWGKLARGPVFQSTFLGVLTWQNPFDAWIIQEIISEVKPDLIIETGTHHGGSALLWALILENINPNGRVITIDIEDKREQRSIDLPIAKRRVDFFLGSSTDAKIVAEVTRRAKGKRVLVILDSLHTKEHVLNELKAYSPLVGVGSYMIVQDTPAGPNLAIKEFLTGNHSFWVDQRRERFIITNTVGGYLKRIR